MPALNAAETVGAVVDDLREAMEAPVIVVDDGSADCTGEIARSFCGVRVFTQVPNQGKGRAVQRGIRESTGDYGRRLSGSFGAGVRTRARRRFHRPVSGPVTDRFDGRVRA